MPRWSIAGMLALAGFLAGAQLHTGGSSAASPGSFPSGLTIPMIASACPTGWTENSALAGNYLIATTVANGDSGTTGGSNSYTPAGANSAPVFLGDAGSVPAATISWPVGVPVFSGSVGTIPAETFTGSTTTVPAETFTGQSTTVPALGAGTLADSTSGSTHKLFTSSSSGVSAATLTGSTATGTLVPLGSNSSTSITPLGSNSTVGFTPTGTVAWPLAVPTNSTVSFTPSGSVAAPAFSGVPTTIQPTFVKVILCTSS